MGLKYILDGLNAERILIAAECMETDIGSSRKPLPMPTTVWSLIGPLEEIKAFNSPSPSLCERGGGQSHALQRLRHV
jgi:hypothetical protein